MPERRKLHFDKIDEALAEADRLASAEREGRVVRAGNWSLGQALGHLATWANFAFEGYPAEVRAPLPVRLMLRAFRGTILNKGMMSGVRVGKVPGGTFGIDELSTVEGLNRFRSAMERLRNESPTLVNPVFGRLTHEKWIQLNLRHAELHLGFQVPQGP
jgi:hypothetical protein